MKYVIITILLSIGIISCGKEYPDIPAVATDSTPCSNSTLIGDLSVSGGTITFNANCTYTSVVSGCTESGYFTDNETIVLPYATSTIQFTPTASECNTIDEPYLETYSLSGTTLTLTSCTNACKKAATTLPTPLP